MESKDRDPYPEEFVTRIRARGPGEYSIEVDKERSWEHWSRAIQGVDERTMKLLRSAFDWGFETGFRQITE